MPWNITKALSLAPFGPDPDFIAGDPVHGPLGEDRGAPILNTTPAGGGGLKRRLICKQYHVLDWLKYYTVTAPLDPYSLNGVLWEFEAAPFEKQERISSAALQSLFPGVGLFELCVLNLTYMSTSMRFFPGQGVVKEEQRPRLEMIPIGIQRYMVSQSGTIEGPTLTWSTGDSKLGTYLYYGEHPHVEVGSREIIITFPFAPSGNEPLPHENSVNSDAFQLPVTGDICAPSTLKYMGCAKEASVVIPAVGIYTGLVRYRKSFIFHYLNAAIGNLSEESQLPYLTWNTFFRARDQNIGTLVDMNNYTFEPCPRVAFSAQNWWL